jgi:hypothetical protein
MAFTTVTTVAGKHMNGIHFTQLILVVLLSASTTFAQKHEIGLTLGAITGTSRSGESGSLNFAAGTALEANYGYRFWRGRRAALLGEVHFLGNPQRRIENAPGSATRDVATIFVTPGVRVKFLPGARFSPYLAGGGGYATFEQSLTTIDTRPNPAPRYTNRGVVDFGGGVDFSIFQWLALRAEFRDFYSGSPNFNIPAPGGQHNLVAGGGFVLRLGHAEN